MNARRPFANPRAESVFVASDLPDVFALVVQAEAHYVMNHVGARYSDCVAMACRYVADAIAGGHALASPTARAMFDEAVSS